MKLQAIFIFSIVIELIYGNPNKLAFGPLNEEENENRLEKCGNFERFPQTEITDDVAYGFPMNFWFRDSLTVSNKDPKYTGESASSMISSRHFITSSQVVLMNGMKWRMNEEQFDGKCLDGTLHAEVAESIVDDLMFSMNTCHLVKEEDREKNDGCRDKRVKAVKAYLLNICHENIIRDFDDFYSPMIVEIDENNWEVDNICVADETTTFQPGDAVDAYGIGNIDKRRVRMLKYHHEHIKLFTDRLIETTPYYYEDDRGGPLVISDKGRWTIIGIGATTALPNQKSALFFNMKSIQDDVCNLAGICPRGKMRTSLTTRIPDPPTPKGSESTKIPDPPTPKDSESTKIPDLPTPKDSESTKIPNPPTPKGSESTKIPDPPTPKDFESTKIPDPPTPKDSKSTKIPNPPTIKDSSSGSQTSPIPLMESYDEDRFYEEGFDDDNDDYDDFEADKFSNGVDQIKILRILELILLTFCIVFG